MRLERVSLFVLHEVTTMIAIPATHGTLAEPRTQAGGVRRVNNKNTAVLRQQTVPVFRYAEIGTRFPLSEGPILITMHMFAEALLRAFEGSCSWFVVPCTRGKVFASTSAILLFVCRVHSLFTSLPRFVHTLHALPFVQ